MKFLTQIETKHRAKIQLNMEELRFLYELDAPIEGFGSQADPRIALIKGTRDVRSDMVIAYNNKYTRDQITTNFEEFMSGKSKVHYGDLDLSELPTIQGLELPEIFYGVLNLGNITSFDGIELPKIMNGAALSE